MTLPLVFNLQRFCIHDGPGIRTTVFFKGCPLRCLWCHNPEGISFIKEPVEDSGKQSAVAKTLPFLLSYGEKMQMSLQESTVCTSDSGDAIGVYLTPEELARLLMRDVSFYDVSGGGITLSGGEPLAQDLDYLLKLLRLLKRRSIHVSMDSSGHVPRETIQQVLPYVDLFMVDYKAQDADLHRRLTGQDNALILDNLRYLSNCGARLWLRVPVVPGGNLGDMPAMMHWAGMHLQVDQVNLLPYHKEGSDKWQRYRLCAVSHGFSIPDAALMENLRQAWAKKMLVPVKLGG